MGPIAGRYLNTIAQPGPVDIHGVIAGLPWDIQEINDEKSFVELVLPASRWKNALIDYYYFAAQKDKSTEERKSLQRLINANRIRFKNNPNFLSKINELESLIDNARSNFNGLENLIRILVDIAYPGEANFTRRITIENYPDDVTCFLDEVWIENSDRKENVLDATGFHTYYNALLSEIIVEKGFWQNGIVLPHYDDDLPNRKARIVDQRDRLNRFLVIVPWADFIEQQVHQIIYKDELTVGIPEVAIENWWQKGSLFPDKARILPPGETAHIGVRTYVVNGKIIPLWLQDIIKQVNLELELQEA